MTRAPGLACNQHTHCRCWLQRPLEVTAKAGAGQQVLEAPLRGRKLRKCILELVPNSIVWLNLASIKEHRQFPREERGHPSPLSPPAPSNSLHYCHVLDMHRRLLHCLFKTMPTDIVSSLTLSHCLNWGTVFPDAFLLWVFPSWAKPIFKLLHPLGAATGNQEGPQILAFLLKLSAFTLTALSLPGAPPAPNTCMIAQPWAELAFSCLVQYSQSSLSWSWNAGDLIGHSGNLIRIAYKMFHSLSGIL